MMSWCAWYAALAGSPNGKAARPSWSVRVLCTFATHEDAGFELVPKMCARVGEVALVVREVGGRRAAERSEEAQTSHANRDLYQAVPMHARDLQQESREGRHNL